MDESYLGKVTSNTPPWVFLNCTSGAKSHNAPQIVLVVRPS